MVGSFGAGPNGLAYDEDNGRLYYCEYYSSGGTAELWFYDGTENVYETIEGVLPGHKYIGEIPAGSGSAGITNADFWDGKYYYIYGATDDLYEVTFDADGYVTGYVNLADVAGNLHGWTFHGDIAIQNGILYGWGNDTHGYEFFKYIINTLDDFEIYNETTDPELGNNFSLQLAFGLDGVLYGHKYGSAFYAIDTTNGKITYQCPSTVSYTDCASGSTTYVCNEETAFGVETEGPGMAWWYYSEGSGTFSIWAGQHYDAGTVTVSECVDGYVTITIDLADGWG